MVKIVATNPVMRVTAGGSFTDFKLSDQESMFEHVKKKIRTWTYISINKVYEFKRIEEDDEEEKKEGVL